MDKISPLSIWEISNNLKFGANKIKNTRKNISSITRINSHNNEKLLSWLKMNSGNKSKEKPKLFSLIDINDKITNSRGTSIPKQYRRLTDKEQQRIFGLFSRYNNNGLKKKFINRSAENIFPQNEINIKNNPKNSKYEFDNNRYKFKKYSFSQRNYKLNDINNTEISKNDEKNKNQIKNKEIENKCVNKDREIFTLKNNSKKLKKAKLIKSQEEKINLNNKKENENDKQNKARDRWLPNGYESYELLIKHPKLFNKKLKMEYSMKNNISAKTIKERANTSDIFFLKIII